MTKETDRKTHQTAPTRADTPLAVAALGRAMIRAGNKHDDQEMRRLGHKMKLETEGETGGTA